MRKAKEFYKAVDILTIWKKKMVSCVRSKVTIGREKIATFDYTKIWNFCSPKDTIKSTIR